MQILVEATGLSRQSIYSVFGDKDGLFREVLKHYRSIVEAQCRILDTDEADLKSLRSFILDGLKSQRDFGSGACFIVVTAFSPQAQNDEIRPALDEGAQRVRSAFESVLARVQRRGYLPRQLSPKVAASHLYAVTNGLSALQQTGATQIEVETALEQAIQGLSIVGPSK